MRKLFTQRRRINIISDELYEIINIIDEYIKRSLKIDCKYQNEIIDSMKYSLFSGGKRLRPVFAIKAFQLFDNDIKQIMPYATAVELIHTYSLIHDDLPAMDDDNLRRGKPTNHIRFGEAMAILAGDSLLNLAFEIMLNDISKETNNKSKIKNKIDAAKLISQASGVKGMIGGQVIDINSSYESMNDQKLLYMYETKTAALFKAAIISGAIIGGASDEEIHILSRYSTLLGISYQIQDDLLDINEDKKNNKFTYLSIFDKKQANENLEKLTKDCLSQLKELNNKDTYFLSELTKLLINRKN